MARVLQRGAQIALAKMFPLKDVFPLPKVKSFFFFFFFSFFLNQSVLMYSEDKTR